MSPIRFRDEESSSNTALYLVIGAVAGFAAGVLVAEQFGGFRALSGRIRDRLGGLGGGEADEDDDLDEDDLEAEDSDSDLDEDEMDDYAASNVAPIRGSDELEERVLEAYRNDPILSERAIDIGAIQEGIIELTGWVNAEDEAKQAVDVARGVPGVETVINRLAVRSDEDLFDEMAGRYESGDASATEGHWEGQQLGTGRRRQGDSSEIDRHADPKNRLEDRSMSPDSAYLTAADDMEPTAERRKNSAKKRAGASRNDGSAVAPTGVPKADHVTDVPPPG